MTPADEALLKEADAWTQTPVQTTHWEGCETTHVRCMIALLAAALRAATERADANEKDAERLRWLLERRLTIYEVDELERTSLVLLMGSWCNGDSRVAIDAARAAERAETERK